MTATYDPELERLAHPDELLPRLETPSEHDDDGDDDDAPAQPDTYQGDDEGDSGSDAEPQPADGDE